MRPSRNRKPEAPIHTPITQALSTAGIFLALAAPDTAIAQDRGEVMQAVIQHPLARTWILNVEESDNAQEKIEQAQRRRSGAGEAGGGGARRGARGEGQRGTRRRGGGGAGARGSGLAPQAMATNRVAQQRIMRAWRVMTIVLTDSTAAIGADDLVPWLFPTDEGKRDHQYGVELTGKWDRDKLVVETNTEGGLRIREVYELKGDDTELQVSVTLENSGNNLRVRFKRVYNAEDATGSDM